ncbi:hypothetical protein [Streptomyces sp. NPDC005538]|uniref:hypothetical protein n=1 Tax=unclassified Streptomyces TaxID=2593676 RepID=UPI0033AB2CA1
MKNHASLRIFTVSVALSAGVVSTPVASAVAQTSSQPSAKSPTFAGFADVPTEQKASGPVDVYRQTGTGTTGDSLGTIAAASSLPFSFVLDEVSFGIYSREWKTTKTTVCIDLQVWKDHGGTATGDFNVALRNVNTDTTSSFITWPVDNVAHTACWTGVSTSATWQTWFGFGIYGNGEYVSGSGRMRN